MLCSVLTFVIKTLLLPSFQATRSSKEKFGFQMVLCQLFSKGKGHARESKVYSLLRVYCIPPN